MSKLKPIHWRKLARVFELDGRQLDRIVGNRIIYTKFDSAHSIITPKENEVDVFIVKNNLRTAKTAREKIF